MPLATIDEAAEEIRHGKLIIIVDDEDRENEGDLVPPLNLLQPRSLILWRSTAVD